MVMIKIAAHVGDVEAITIVIKVAAHHDDDDNDDPANDVWQFLKTLNCLNLLLAGQQSTVASGQRLSSRAKLKHLGKKLDAPFVLCLRVSPCNLGRIRGAAHRC